MRRNNLYSSDPYIVTNLTKNTWSEKSYSASWILDCWIVIKCIGVQSRLKILTLSNLMNIFTSDQPLIFTCMCLSPLCKLRNYICICICEHNYASWFLSRKKRAVIESTQWHCIYRTLYKLHYYCSSNLTGKTYVPKFIGSISLHQTRAIFYNTVLYTYSFSCWSQTHVGALVLLLAEFTIIIMHWICSSTILSLLASAMQCS